jgi:DNA-binding MarR family transcriptional regulator
MHFLEISSGSEILKRLIRNKMVYEYPDLKDGRAKRVSLTQEGYKEIMNAFDEMHKVSEIVVGDISGEELTETLAVLNKLNFFHMHIHKEAKDDSLNEILKNYISST